MANMTSDFFAGNRQKLLTLFTGSAPIVLTAHGLLQRNSDVSYGFRQDSSFYYLTGITDPDIILVMDKGKEYLIVPERDEHRAAFDGDISHETLMKVSGVSTVYGEKEGWKLLGSRLKRVKHAATLSASPTYVDAMGFYVNPARMALQEKMLAQNADIQLLDLRSHLAVMRMIKQPIEIDCMQQAIDLTTDSLLKLQKKGWHKFAYEYELEAALTAAFKSKGAEHAYHPIVASGQNAVTLHYVANNQAIATDQLLLLDVGSEVNYYAADITRTYAVSEPTKRQQQVYDAVVAVQDYALEQLKVGVTMRQYEQAIEQYMGEKLREIGLIKSIEHDAVRTYYPHATSHFLGLDVHDAADYDRPLEPGVVLTVEPGIYIREEGIGIRIEDNIHLTADGPVNLSARLPRVLQ